MNVSFSPRSLLAVLGLTVLALTPLDAQTTVAPPGEIPGLTRLEASYAKEVGEKVETPQQAALKRLNDSYQATVEAALKKMADQGLLDEAQALQQETKRFAESHTVPEQDEAGVNPAVAKLRSFWRAENGRITRQRAANLQPLTAAYVASLRTLEKELTRSLKLDEARVVRNKAEALAPAPPAIAAVPSATPAVAATAAPARSTGMTPLVASSGGPAERVELYAASTNRSSLYVNGKEASKDVNHDSLIRVRMALHEGDVIAIKNPRFDDNCVWLMAVATSAEFLFDSSIEWRCYLPKDRNKWWDVKNVADEASAELAPETQTYSLVRHQGTKSPYYRATAPIRSAMKEEATPPAAYCYHIVTKQDLTPKKLAPIPSPAVVLSAPWLGKVVHLKTDKEGAEGVIGEDQAIVAPFNSAAADTSLFKIAKGPQPGTVSFESQRKRGFFLRHVDSRIRLVKGLDPKISLFEFKPPVRGDEGLSIVAFSYPGYFWQTNEKKEILHGGRMDQNDSVFFLEEVAPKR